MILGFTGHTHHDVEEQNTTIFTHISSFTFSSLLTSRGHGRVELIPAPFGWTHTDGGNMLTHG